MGKKGTKNPTTIATVTIATLLVVSSLGMGVRQLLREGVFSETQPIALKPPATPEAPLVKQPTLPSGPGDVDLRIQAEQQVEQETVSAPAEPQPAQKEAPKPPQQTSPMPDRQPAPMASNSRNLSRDEQDQLNYEYIRAIWPSLSEQDREEARRVMERWPTMSDEERDFYRGLVENLQ